MRIFFGTSRWGWKIYGIGGGTRWFLGLSLRLPTLLDAVMRDALVGGLGYARVDPAAATKGATILSDETLRLLDKSRTTSRRIEDMLHGAARPTPEGAE